MFLRLINSKCLKIKIIHTIFNSFVVKTDASVAQIYWVENEDKDTNIL